MNVYEKRSPIVFRLMHVGAGTNSKKLACCEKCRRTKPPEIPNGGISGGCRLLKGRLRLFDMMRHAGRRIVSGMSPFDRACADFAQTLRPASGRARFTARGGRRRQSCKTDRADKIRRRCPSKPPSPTAAPDAGLMLCAEITFLSDPSSDRAVTQLYAETVCTRCASFGHIGFGRGGRAQLVLLDVMHDLLNMCCLFRIQERNIKTAHILPPEQIVGADRKQIRQLDENVDGGLNVVILPIRHTLLADRHLRRQLDLRQPVCNS